MIVRAAHENLLPRLVVGRVEPGPRHKSLNARGSQRFQGIPRCIAQPGMVPPVDAFEVPEDQSKLLEVQRSQLLVGTVQRMRHGVRQRLFGQIALQIEDIVSTRLDLPVLGFREAPDQDVHFAFVVGKVRRHLLAKNHSGQVRNLQTSGDRVVIGDRHELHADFTKTLVKLQRIRIARRKFQTTKHPVRSASAVAGMNMKVGFRLRRVHRSERRRASQSVIGNRLATSKRRAYQFQRLPSNRAVLPVHRMQADAQEWRPEKPARQQGIPPKAHDSAPSAADAPDKALRGEFPAR